MVVKKDFAKVSTVRKVVLEHDLTTEGNVAAEVVPLLQPETKGLLEGLYVQVRRQYGVAVRDCENSPGSMMPYSSGPSVPFRAQLAPC